MDTWEMVFAHRIYRREFRILPGIIRAVADGDRARSELVGAHLHRIAQALHHHHEAEDDLLWPIMLQRVISPDAEIVLRMESQHERLEGLLKRVDELNTDWRATAAAQVRDDLADVLAQASSALDEHLSDEERDLLPLVPGNVSHEEWDALNTRARNGMAAKNPKTALVLFGFAIEDATPLEKQRIMADLPAPLRLVWRLLGRRMFVKARDELRHG
ncbi:hypothetical protein Kisp01_57130 [Kineosporia sp. NBRC 101677]|nr:hypothetical protein Kisp01_57130 [Kineosporia sp. NBRC 101677]